MDEDYSGIAVAADPCPVPLSLTVRPPSSGTPALNHIWIQADHARVAERRGPSVAVRCAAAPPAGVPAPDDTQNGIATASDVCDRRPCAGMPGQETTATMCRNLAP